MNEIGLKSRVEKSRAAARFAKVIENDTVGRARLVVVPGSEGKQYTVELIRWDAHGMILTDCHDHTEICKGNSAMREGPGGICYHSLAALVAAGARRKHLVRFCEDDQDASRLTRLGYKVFCVRSNQGLGRVWMATKQEARNAS